MVKNLRAMLETRFNPWVRKIPWRREWQPTPVFLCGEFSGQRGLAGYIPWACKELDMTKQQLTHKEGAQPHPSADNWIKALMNTDLPTRARPSFSHHQSLSSGSLYKPLKFIQPHPSGGRQKKKEPQSHSG